MIISCWDWIVPGKTYQEKFENLEKWGLSGIEIGLFEGQDLKKAQNDIKKAVNSTNIKVSQVIAVSDAFGAIASDENTKKAKVDITKKSIEITAEVGGDFSLVLPEYAPQMVIPNVPLATPTPEEEDFFLQYLDEVGEYAEKFGLAIVIEPVNRYENHFYHSPLKVMEICQRTGRDNIKTLADFFHMSLEEPDIIKAIEGAGDYIYHVHFTDSNRTLPGNGLVDWEAGVAALKKIGYDRFLSSEAHPVAHPEIDLPQYAKYTKELWEKS